MTVGALMWDSTAKARLVEALRPQSLLRFCESRKEILALVENDLVHVVVVDIHDQSGESTVGLVRRLRSDFPSIPIVLYWGLAPDSGREIVEFVRAGVHELVLRGVDDLRAPLRSAIAAAQDHCSSKSIMEELGPHVPPTVQPILRYCLENGRRALTVQQLAAALHVHRKTLVDRLTAANYPSPSAIIAWSRLMVAARLMEDPGRSVEQVALLLDFPSGTSMRNMVKRYTGLRPVEVRENGGMRCVLHAFKLAISGVAKRDRG